MDERALAPCEAKWKPGRGAEQPIFIQALLLSPGQKEVNEVNALLMSRTRLTLISKRSFTQLQVNRCSCGRGGGGSCRFPEPAFTFQSSELRSR